MAGSHDKVIIDPGNKRVCWETRSFDDTLKSYIVINAYPIEISIYDSVKGKEFLIEWITNSLLRSLQTRVTLNETADYIKELGFSPSPYYLEGTLTNIVTIFIKEDIVKIEDQFF